MATDYRPYDPSEIESIRMMLSAEAREGRPLCYEVKVNGFTRIHKTSNVERFEELHNYLNENTKELVISVYPDALSNRKEWYKYKMNAAPEPAPALNGVDMEAKISERMKAFEEKMAVQRTEEKLQEAQHKLEQAELYIDILEEKLEEAKSKPNHLGSFDLGKLASSTIEGIALHYPKVLDKVPVLNGIAKVIQEEHHTRPGELNGGAQGEVSFKVKSAEPPVNESHEHDEAVQQLSEFIGEHFDQNQKLILGAVIMALGENTTQLQPVAELLNIDVNAILSEEEQE